MIEKILPTFEGSVLVLVLASVAPPWLSETPFSCEVTLLAEDATASTVNEAVSRGGNGCDVILLIGAKAAQPSPDALRRLASLFSRPDVAAVGPVFTGRDGRIVAAGLVMGGAAVLSPGMAGSLVAMPGPTRDVSALPADLVFASRTAWLRAGGLDPRFTPKSVGFADFCLRLGKHGAVLLDESADVAVQCLVTMDYTELMVFAARHADTLRQGDPWYHPFLADDGSWTLRKEPCRIAWPARVVAKRKAQVHERHTRTHRSEKSPKRLEASSNPQVPT